MSIATTTPVSSSPTSPPAGPDFSARELTGVVRDVREAGDNGWCIVRLDQDRTATGEISEDDGELQQGVAYRFFGEWTHHEKHGDQFRFTSFTLAARQQQMGVVAYLTRKPFEMTKANVMRAWAKFGTDTLDMIREQPGEVVTACEFSEQAAERLHAAAAILRDAGEFEAVKVALYELFAGRGFPGKTVRACVKQWGVKAPEIIRRDPFQLIVRDITGVGFRRADKLFIDLGGDPARLKRAMLAGWEALRTEQIPGEFSGSGNTWKDRGFLCRAILRATGDQERINKAIELGLRARWLSRRVDADFSALLWANRCVMIQEWFAEKGKAAAEQRLAKHVLRVMGHAPKWPQVTAEDLPDEHQRGRLAEIANSPLAILNGSPGVGKTFTAAVLIRVLLRMVSPGRISVAAPTGKAAVRITESMHNNGITSLTASTIHRLLEIDGSTKSGDFTFMRNESNPLDCDFLFLDESSMDDTGLLACLFAAVRAGCNVLMLGDSGQLPPVAHGRPMLDMIDAGIPTATLTEIKRNDGAIVQACKSIKDGARFTCSPRADADAGLNLLHVPAEDANEQANAVVGIISKAREKGFDPVWDCQVVCVTNDKSEISRKPMNVMLQNVLNPLGGWLREDQTNALFRPGDKCVCRNNTEVSAWEERPWDDLDRTGEMTELDTAYYRRTPGNITHYVANGDLGRVLATDAKSAIVRFLQPDRIVCVQTGKRKKKENEGSDKLEFELGYALTIHLSQGSEWPVIIAMIDEGAGPLGCRELIYTAISRAARLCFLVGSLATAQKWGQRAGLVKRKTFLREILTAKMAAMMSANQSDAFVVESPAGTFETMPITVDTRAKIVNKDAEYIDAIDGLESTIERMERELAEGLAAMGKVAT